MPSPFVETIIYRAVSCLGSCPEYSFIVSSNGRGLYNGRQYVAVKGERTFHVSPEQFEAFSAQLLPYRPDLDGDETIVTEGTPLCPTAGTDSPTVEVTWIRDGHLAGHVIYYFGCEEPKVPANMGRDLASAPSLLPVSQFVRPH